MPRRDTIGSSSRFFDNLVDSNVIAGVLDGIQVRPDNDDTNEPTNPDFVTDGNTFRRNSIWGIVNGFGIDIARISSINDTAGELSVGVQEAITGPRIGTATEDAVVVTARLGCLIELSITDAGFRRADGQGRTFVDEVVVGGSGVATLTLRDSTDDPYVLRAGDRVSATATRLPTTTRTTTTTLPGASTSPVRGAGGDLAPAVRCASSC